MKPRQNVIISRRAFTLVEMMVALAVLTLIVLMVSQLTSNASRTVSSGKQTDADAQARVIFNRMAADFAHMLQRPDIDFKFKQPAGVLPAQYGSVATPDDPQPGNDRLAFYSESVGYFPAGALPTGSDKSPVSLVAYQIANDPNALPDHVPVLRRMGKGLCWTPNAGHHSPAYLPVTISDLWGNLSGPAYDDYYKTTGDLVFRLEYTYLLKPADNEPACLSIIPWRTTGANPSAAINGFRDVAAIVITIAILDGASRKLVSDYAALIAALPDADGEEYVAVTWNNIVNSPNFAANAKIPKPAAGAVRIYERYFYLNTQ